MDKNTKITVIGIGGVGGYVGGMLAKEYSHVTLVARGERKRVLLENGICLHSDYNGEMRVEPWRIVENPKEIEEVQDFVFLCVKTYSLEQVCKDFAGCIDSHTVVVPVMNGADTALRTEGYLLTGLVVPAVIYITAFFNEDYSITQLGNYARIQIGANRREESFKEAARLAGACMEQAGMDIELCEDVEAAIWEKYIFNCGYNVITAYYMAMVEELQASKKQCGEFRQLMEEAFAVAEAKKIQVREGYLESEYRRFLSLDKGSTSSLKRDMEAGRQNELETFSGYLVREAERLGVPVPLSEKMYRELLRRGENTR